MDSAGRRHRLVLSLRRCRCRRDRPAGIVNGSTWTTSTDARRSRIPLFGSMWELQSSRTHHGGSSALREIRAAETATVGTRRGGATMSTALVTGRSSGIGFATALRLAADGMRVVATMRNAEGRADTLLRAAGERGVALEVRELDVTPISGSPWPVARGRPSSPVSTRPAPPRPTERVAVPQLRPYGRSAPINDPPSTSTIPSPGPTQGNAPTPLAGSVTRPLQLLQRRARDRRHVRRRRCRRCRDPSGGWCRAGRR